MINKLIIFFIERYVFLFSLCFGALSLYSIYIHVNHSIFFFLLTYALAVIYIYLIIKLFQFNRYIYLVATFLFLLFFSFFTFIKIFFNIDVTADFISEMLNYNGTKINFSLINFRFIIFVIFVIFFWIFSVFPVLFYKKQITFFKKKSFIIGIILFAIALKIPTLEFMLFKHRYTFIYPHKVIYFIKYYYLDLRPFEKNVINRYSLANQLMKQKGLPLTIVFYIGESERGDHLSMNGYSLPTTPMLSSEKNIINFKYARSCSNNTIKSVPCMLTNFENASQENLPNIFMQKSVIDIFEKNYFHTFFIGTKERKPLDFYLGASAQTIYNSTYPHNDLNKVMQKKASSIFSLQGNRFILIRNMGSHYPYSISYPKKFEKFTPTCGTFGVDCSDKDLSNTYDNTVYYTDYLIASIIKELKKQKTNILFLYTSDHGESLGENGNYLHPTNAIENRVVSLFFWVSDSFKKNYALDYQNLVNNAKKYPNQTTHNVIWHTLLDVAGFKNKDKKGPLKKNKSLVSNEFKPEIPSNWFDKEVFDSN
jgi:glucan phosphoethanolaminetransferase (alkaline phosphatase superfamily)